MWRQPRREGVFPMSNEIKKQVSLGLIDAAARLICDQIRVSDLQTPDLDPQTRMTLACLAEQIRKIAPDAPRA